MNAERVTIDCDLAKLSPALSAKYQIVSKLGQGGVGQVLLARHLHLKSVVAIKLLAEQAADSAARLVREARAVAGLRSQHVARVLDVEVPDTGAPFIVMEYLRGRDLSQLVAAEGPLSVQVAVDYMMQALEAVAEAHAVGIVHRDLKPANLFAAEDVAEGTCIKVLDFGLAKYTSHHDTTSGVITESGSMLGTPSYMAPEQFLDAQQADARSDVWAMGASLFELLSGSPPFRGASLPQLYAAVMHGPIPRIRSLRPAVPEGLEAIVNSCLTREPAGRYGSALALAEALAPFGGQAAPRYLERVRRISGYDSRTVLAPAHASDATSPPTLAPSIVEVQQRNDVRVAYPRLQRAFLIGAGVALCGLLLLQAASEPSSTAAPTAAASVALPKPTASPPPRAAQAAQASGAEPAQPSTTSGEPAEQGHAIPAAKDSAAAPKRRAARRLPKASPQTKRPTLYERYP